MQNEPRQLIHHPDPERSDEETRLKARIDALREELALATAELEELRADLTAFEIRFDARIGVLIVELDRLTVEIEEYQRRLNGLDRPLDEWNDIEDEIRHAFKSTRERLEHDEHEARDAETRATALPPEPTQDTKETLKQIYRRLARMYHPDTAQDENQRATHESAMRRINAAFEQYDLGALERLEIELPAHDTQLKGETSAERVAAAIGVIDQLERALREVRVSIARLRSTEKFRLRESVLADPHRLDALENTYRADIETARRTRDQLIDNYRSGMNQRIIDGES